MHAEKRKPEVAYYIIGLPVPMESIECGLTILLTTNV
jgi:hypothetical protein